MQHFMERVFFYDSHTYLRIFVNIIEWFYFWLAFAFEDMSNDVKIKKKSKANRKQKT